MITNNNFFAVAAMMAALALGIAFALAGCAAQTIQPGIYTFK